MKISLRSRDWVEFCVNVFVEYGSTVQSVKWNVLSNTILNYTKITASYADDAIATGAKEGSSAFKAIGSTAWQTFHIIGGVGGIVFMFLDIKTCVDSVNDIHRKNPHEAVKEIREMADNINKSCPTKREIECTFDKTFHRSF